MLNPRAITKEIIRERVSAALKKRAPDNNVTAWLSILAEKTGAGDTAVYNWYHGVNPPDTEGFWRLCAHFGAAFANECWGDVTGIESARGEHVEAIQKANELAKYKTAVTQFKGVIADLEGNVVDLKEASK